MDNTNLHQPISAPTADQDPTPTMFLAFNTYELKSSSGSSTKHVRPYIFYGLCRGAPSVDALESAQTTPASRNTEATSTWNERILAACSLAHTLAGDLDEYAKYPHADFSEEALTVHATREFEALRQSSAAPCSLLTLDSTDRQELTRQIASILRQGGRQVGQEPTLIRLDQSRASGPIGASRALPRIRTVLDVPSSAISESSQSGILGRDSLVSPDSRSSVVYVSPLTPLGPPQRLNQDFTGLGDFDISIDSPLGDGSSTAAASTAAGPAASAAASTLDTFASDVLHFHSQSGGFEPF